MFKEILSQYVTLRAIFNTAPYIIIFNSLINLAIYKIANCTINITYTECQIKTHLLIKHLKLLWVLQFR